MALERALQILLRQIPPSSVQVEHVLKIKRALKDAKRSGVTDVTPEELLMKRIPPETLHKLEEQGFFISTLTSESIRSLQEKGERIILYDNVTYPEGFQFRPSRLTQVAFNPSAFLRWNTYEDNQRLFKRFAGIEFSGLRGVEVIWGDAADYIELISKKGQAFRGMREIVAGRTGITFTPVIRTSHLGITVSDLPGSSSIILPLLVAR